MKAVHLGLRRRRSPALASSFFDPDMPAEWRVAFLLNEQDALWVAGDDPDVETVLAELAEAPAPVVVVVEAAAWSPAWDEVCDGGYHRVIRVDSDTSVWRPEDDVRGASVGLVPASDDAAMLRDWLDRFAGQAPAEAALFVDGDPPSVATVDRLRTLVELMGL
ncbi:MULTISPECIES: hypothetical protein [unclassified Guyparkeria]|uniref:hypothetical protein n=1 Tax=unclassified Guyparkeria TaxID=2626246 RepID=UPI0007337BDC|nr:MULTISPECIES: hypothetical protein [unclassified Guyparkeria]KTG17901.1 hypothetical protein AUR63_07235 [Guyparkeria sp. XI15]OAE89611.1 hypothetical protein AWR35_07250 [Guyparkeria sp. WRN-7]